MPTMTRKTSLSILILAFLLLSLTASSALVFQPVETASAAEKPADGAVVARIYFASFAELNRLAASLDVWEVNHPAGYFVALLASHQYDALAQAGYRLEIDAAKTADLYRPRQPSPGQTTSIPGFLCYRTVEETYTDLAQLATDNPDLAIWTDIGESWEKVTPGGAAGYDIGTLILTNKAIPGPKPKFYLMSAIHAREYATAELATRFGEYLVNGYGVDPDLTWLLDYFEIHITPHMNPDGRKIAETGDLWRKNTDNDDGCSSASNWGTDLNRNSSFKWGGVGASPFACDETYRGPSAGSEPETQAMQQYVASLFPDLRGSGDNDPAPADTEGVFITLHSYSELVLFPWGWTTAAPPNNTALETLGRKFGYFNHYTVCQSGEFGCIYQTSGSSDDWAYGELGVAAYTYEVGTTFFQSCTYFENTLLPDNLPALLYAFKAARRPYQNPAGPDTLDVAVSNKSAAAGTVTLTATADDTRYDDGGWFGTEPTQDIAAARYSVDKPSWEAGVTTYPLDPADGSFNAKTEGLQTTIDTSSWSAGRHILFVESQDAAGNWGVPGAVFLTVSSGDEYQPGLEPPTSEGRADPGEIVDYTLQVTNLGSVADTFDIQIIGNQWQTTADPNPVGPLDSGANADLTISVTIPPDAVPGESDTATITAISQGNDSKSATVTVTTYVQEPYSFSLTPEYQETHAKPGSQVTFILNLTNTGSLADSYQVNLSGDEWDSIIEGPAGVVQPGVTVEVLVTVTIPDSALEGDFDEAEVTVTSQGNPSKSTSVTVKTVATFPRVVFMPLIGRYSR